MKKDFEYIVRYDDGHVINTMFCTNYGNMTDFTKMLERQNIIYMVIKVKDATNFELRCLTDCTDLFKEKDDNND